jgi:hypothetical protein
MASAATYTPIATYTVPSATASYTFSSIPGTYTDLVLIANVQGTTGGNGTTVQFNSDTSTNYSYTLVDGSGSSATSARSTNSTNIQSGLVDNVSWGTQIIHIMNYSNTTTYKTVLGRGNDTLQLRATVGLWRNTSAISSVTVLAAPNAYNFIAGSTFTLYGILAA